MTWDEILTAVSQTVDAHVKLPKAEIAQILQQQLGSQPLVGWFLLAAVGMATDKR